jgi:hypothetical protein
MRTKKLPVEALNILGIKHNKNPEAAAYLKKVQDLYCDRLSRHNLCPLKCWRCASRIVQMARDTAGTENQVAYWHRVCQSTAAQIVEEYLEHQPRPVAKPSQPLSMGDMAARFMEQLTREDD